MSEAAEKLTTDPKNWPSEGSIQFTDYCTKYRPDLELVLNNINLLIKPGEKVHLIENNT